VLAIFRSNQLLFGFLFIFYVALLHGSAFLIPDNWQPFGYGILSSAVYNQIGFKGLYPDLLSALLVFIQGFLVSALALRHKFARDINILPGLFFILVACASPAFLHLSPLHFANFFLILCIGQLLSTYRSSMVSGRIYDTGLLLGLASMFYPCYWVLIFFVFAGLNILRRFDIRERLMVLAGFVTVYILVGTVYFMTDQFDNFYTLQIVRSIHFLDFRTISDDFAFVRLSLLGLLLLLVIFSQGQFMQKRNIQAQKSINLLYWGLLIGGLALVVQGNVQEDAALIIAIPLGMLLSLQFNLMRANIAELLHLILLVIVLFLQYRPWLLP